MNQAEAQSQPSSPILQNYLARTERSADLTKAAARVMPGGNTRTTTYHPPYSPVFTSGEGAWLTDADENDYLDLFYNGLSLIHGHQFAPVVSAIDRVLSVGTAWSGGNSYQFELAELLVQRIRPGSLVRFTCSGSEACMLACSLARRATGKDVIVKFSRAYHGSYPDLEAGLYGNGELPGRTLVLPFNDAGALEACLAANQSQIAAIIFEPVMYTGRVVLPEQGYLLSLQKLAKRYRVLTILDDCLMFRLASGGSTQYFELNADLVALGKFIGGGTPVGAVVGDPDLMAILDPSRSGSMFHGGSFNGNVLGAAAGLAALKELTAERIKTMESHCQCFVAGLKNASEAAGLATEVTSLGSVVGIAFDDDSARHEDAPGEFNLTSRFVLACLNNGLAIGPGGLFALATCVDESAVDFAVENAAAALAELADECL